MRRLHRSHKARHLLRPAGGGIVLDPNVVEYFLEDVNEENGGPTLTNIGSVTFPAGLFNNAASFSGTGQRLESNDTYFQGLSANSFEMMAHINLDVTGRVHGIAGQTTSQYHWHIISSNAIRWRVLTNVAGRILNTTATLSASTWYHISVGYDASAEELFVTVDGGTPETLSIAGETIQTGTNIFSIGSIASGNVMDGLIDSFSMVNNRLFTPAERTNHRTTGTVY